MICVKENYFVFSFISFFFFLKKKKESEPKKEEKTGATTPLIFSFPYFDNLSRCAMRTFLQKYSPIARIFGKLGTKRRSVLSFLQKRCAHACVFGVLIARLCLCIHFYKNAHTHSHFQGGRVAKTCADGQKMYALFKRGNTFLKGNYVVIHLHRCLRVSV